MSASDEELDEALTFHEELLVELLEHARAIRRSTGFVALVLAVYVGVTVLGLLSAIVFGSVSFR
jgi:hypothetical protein